MVVAVPASEPGEAGTGLSQRKNTHTLPGARRQYKWSGYRVRLQGVVGTAAYWGASVPHSREHLLSTQQLWPGGTVSLGWSKVLISQEKETFFFFNEKTPLLILAMH